MTPTLRVRHADGTTAPVLAIDREGGRWWLLVAHQGRLVTMLADEATFVDADAPERAQEAIAAPAGPMTSPRRRRAAQGRRGAV